MSSIKVTACVNFLLIGSYAQKFFRKSFHSQKIHIFDLLTDLWKLLILFSITILPNLTSGDKSEQQVDENLHALVATFSFSKKNNGLKKVFDRNFNGFLEICLFCRKSTCRFLCSVFDRKTQF